MTEATATGRGSVRVPLARLRAGDLPLVCVKTGARADHAVPVTASRERFLVPVSRPALRRAAAARRVELAAYSGGLTAVALVVMALVVLGSPPPRAAVAALVAAALAAGLLASRRRRRTGVTARREGDSVVLSGVAPGFAAAVRGGATPVGAEPGNAGAGQGARPA